MQVAILCNNIPKSSFLGWRVLIPKTLFLISSMWLTTFSKDFSYLFFRERGREGEREKHQCMRDISIGCLSRDLSRNQTCDLSVHRLALNPLSHTSQGWLPTFIVPIFPLFYMSSSKNQRLCPLSGEGIRGKLRRKHESCQGSDFLCVVPENRTRFKEHSCKEV